MNIEATNGIPISLNLACKILHKGKAKVKRWVDIKRINIIPNQGNSSGLNLFDVLNNIGKN